jgi:hypothetical protein
MGPPVGESHPTQDGGAVGDPFASRDEAFNPFSDEKEQEPFNPFDDDEEGE